MPKGPFVQPTAEASGAVMKRLLAHVLLFAAVSFPTALFGSEPGWWTEMKRNCRTQGGTISDYYNSYTGCHLPSQPPSQTQQGAPEPPPGQAEARDLNHKG